MKKKLLSLLLLAIPMLTFAQEKGLDQQIDEAFGNATGWFVDFIFYQIPFTDTISVYWVLFPLILGATYFTFYFNFINFRGFFTSINIVRGKYDGLEGKGEGKAIEVDGVFDDCQRMVKEAFVDDTLTSAYKFSSANSINIARLIPQSFYYFEAYKQLKDKSKEISFSIPSGNFGNLTAGLLAKKMGLPVKYFLAATNINNTVPEYLESGLYKARPSVQTISNAMDVGDPSNFSRMSDLYGSTWNMMQKDILGYSFSDQQTKEALIEIKDKFNYSADPHGAVGYLAAKAYLKKYPEDLQNMLRGKKELNVKTSHTNQYGTFNLDFDKESDGTITIFNDAGVFLKILEEATPRTIFIDELDIHLHPNLVKQIVEIFNSESLNKNNSQLIFTTHNTSLLSKGIFEREQIWFVDRNANQESELYSLANFSERKTDGKSYEKRYLERRYGAVPLLDELNGLIHNR